MEDRGLRIYQKGDLKVSNMRKATKDCKSFKEIENDHLARIVEWQGNNEGKLCMPPRSFDHKLYSWIQKCRHDYLQRDINPELSDSLLALGLLNETGAQEPRESQVDYDRAFWAICTIKRMGGEDSSGPSVEELRKDELLCQWLEDMSALAGSNPQSMLISDLRWLIPRVYKQVIAPALSSDPSCNVERRNGENLIFVLHKFTVDNGRLPDIFSSNIDERKVASWLIRMEVGFESLTWNEIAQNPGCSMFVEDILTRLRSADRKQRTAQWRWWSSIAMEAMRNPIVGDRWQDTVFNQEPLWHAQQLRIDLANAKSGKPGWQGGPWGVDLMSVMLASGKASKTVLPSTPKLTLVSGSATLPS